VAAIHKHFTYRMHDLGEFMKGLLQRYAQWHNRAHSRTGRLWEGRFKSVIVEELLVALDESAWRTASPFNGLAGKSGIASLPKFLSAPCPPSPPFSK
jgi:hypothetical protein